MSERVDEIIKELGYEPAKSKVPQVATPDVVQGRDLFQTPNYAVDVLLPFVPRNIKSIWEPACGEGKIVARLTEAGYSVYPSDIRKAEGWVDNHIFNFLKDTNVGAIPISILTSALDNTLAIITNPPFSLKKKFYERCRLTNRPFALLIPADYSGWIIQATIDGCEKIIPTRRIDYITPNILQRIHEGEIWKVEGVDRGCTLAEYKRDEPVAWKVILESYEWKDNYKTVGEVPVHLLNEYSSSDFHSMWLTWGFGLGKTETFVELSVKDKKENI